MRAETGPIQFGDDWPGVFIRGDNAFHFAMHLATILADVTNSPEHPMSVAILRNGLLDILRSPIVSADHEPECQLATLTKGFPP